MIQEYISSIKKIFQQQGISQAVIGVSGGVDSATSLCLVSQALGPKSVFPVLLPYGHLHPHSVTDAVLVLNYCNIPEQQREIIDIQSIVDTFFADEGTVDPLRKGNAMARVRMMYLFDRAKKHKALVVGTENKTEHYLGYYTRFGDEASDIEPLRQLYKSQVYTLAKILGVPNSILTKAPTAGLWDGQTDEQEFGFSYNDADKILSMYIDQKKSKHEIIQSGIPEEIVNKVIHRVEENAFKHRLPYTIE